MRIRIHGKEAEIDGGSARVDVKEKKGGIVIFDEAQVLRWSNGNNLCAVLEQTHFSYIP